MNTNQQTQKAQQEPKAQGQFVEPKVYLKGDYLTLVLPGNVLVRKHVNYFKKILGVSFIAKAAANPQIA